MIHFKLEIDDIKSDLFMDLVCNVVTKTFYQVDCYCEGIGWEHFYRESGNLYGGYESVKVVVDNKDITEYITDDKIDSLMNELNERRIHEI